jgi:hypothetical protein
LVNHYGQEGKASIKRGSRKNPLVMKIVINALGKLGTSAFFNGLACSNMSLGALIILLTWMIAIKRKSNALNRRIGDS